MELNVQLTQHAWANVNKLLTTAFHLFVEIYKSDASDQLGICSQWSDILRNQSYHANTCYCHRNNTRKPQNRYAKWTGWSTLSQILNIEATAHFWYAKGLFFFTGDKIPQNAIHNTRVGQRTKSLLVQLCSMPGHFQFLHTQCQVTART